MPPASRYYRPPARVLPSGYTYRLLRDNRIVMQDTYHLPAWYFPAAVLVIALAVIGLLVYGR